MSVKVSPSGMVLFTLREKELAYEQDQGHIDVVQPYAAYSPPGHPKV